MTYEFIVKNFANNLYVFFCSLHTNRTVIKTDTEETKRKSEKKDKDFDVQRKAGCDEDGDSATVIGEVPPQNSKYSLHFVMDSQNPAHAMKSRCTECFLWAYVECLDAETHMYVCD